MSTPNLEDLPIDPLEGDEIHDGAEENGGGR